MFEKRDDLRNERGQISRILKVKKKLNHDFFEERVAQFSISCNLKYHRSIHFKIFRNIVMFAKPISIKERILKPGFFVGRHRDLGPPVNCQPKQRHSRNIGLSNIHIRKSRRRKNTNIHNNKKEYLQIPFRNVSEQDLPNEANAKSS